MATDAEAERRVELGLSAVEAILADLPAVVDSWREMTEDERLVWRMEWGNEMARLRHLAAGARARRLSPSQAERCRSLTERIGAMRESIELLGLHIPMDAAGDVPTAGRSRRAAG
jgi:hypothetical protein